MIPQLNELVDSAMSNVNLKCDDGYRNLTGGCELDVLRFFGEVFKELRLNIVDHCLFRNIMRNRTRNRKLLRKTVSDQHRKMLLEIWEGPNVDFLSKVAEHKIQRERWITAHIALCSKAHKMVEMTMKEWMTMTGR
ncbi:hypothetical protein Ocin01_02844 [Orchesella cincta]|uniref:Uncharacterized protein n=1 Tax=Orchesella cincta TaxID=48709 RepID=A0A1D2NEY7_ORCCI|nr:hypothetical protein Ocin01_02844 [Orchesella cincta]